MWKEIFAILFYACSCVLAEQSRVCYFRNKSYKGRGKARFAPEHVDPYLCTTINYAFLQIDMQTSEVGMTMKEDADLIARLVALKKINPSLKVAIAIGGWNHEKKPRFSNMVHTKEQRTTFVKSVVEFLKKHKLDGVSLDWMYPGIRPKNTPATDKFCFTKLLKEFALNFKTELEKSGKRYSLSAYVGATKNKINAGYQIDKMAMYLDRVDVMAHSLWGPWKKGKHKVTGSHTAMNGTSFTVADVIDLWLKAGMPANKINLVLTSFGRSFQLADSKKNGLGAPFTGPGKPEKFSNGKGIMSYYEICDKKWDRQTDHGVSKTLTPYASKDELWVGYDDEESINYKILNVVKKLDLNGITFWALDWDDFEGESCRRGKFPLLNAAVNALTPPDINHCSDFPCLNNGECVPNVDGYTCKCRRGFAGSKCETKDYCLESRCRNNGTCVNLKNGFKCICPKQYRGKTCNTKDYCFESRCKNNGTCFNLKNGFKCICPKQYRGKTCNKCAEDHAICNMFDDPSYYCGHGWMVRNCAIYCGKCNPENDRDDDGELTSGDVKPRVDDVVIPKPVEQKTDTKMAAKVVDQKEEDELVDEVDFRDTYE